MTRRRPIAVAIGALWFPLLATSAVAGSPPPFDDGPLAFELPSAEQLDLGGRLVFAHYFTPYPISIDNRPSDRDYYATEYLDPAGEDGRYAATGGLLRQRPLPRPVNPSARWDLEDMKTEVQRAADVGIDGFTVDIVGLEGFHWHRLELLIEAATEVDPDFRIVLMPDAYTGATDDPIALADAIASIADEPSVYHLDDGRLVVAPFLAEQPGATYWAEWIGLMAERGIDVALVPVLLEYRAHAATFAEFSAGLSVWGGRSPAGVRDLANMGKDTHDRGLLWMQPVAVQDIRPKTSVFDESNNTETLRDMWDAAERSDAEWVQLVTWNDYSESTEFAPSTNTGWSVLDITAYYIAAFKTGTPPAIIADRVYVSHRAHSVDALPTGGQTHLMKVRRGSSPPRDVVEVLTMLRDGAEVEATIGDVTYSYDAPAGIHAEDLDLSVGIVEIRATAPDGAVSAVRSPTTIIDSPAVQDLQYHFAGSAREGPEGITPTDAATPSTTVPTTASTSPSLPRSTHEPTAPNASTVAPAPISSSAPTDDGSDSVRIWGAAVAVVAVVATAVVVALRLRSRSRRTHRTRPGRGEGA